MKSFVNIAGLQTDMCARDVTNTKESSLSIVTLCDRHVFRKASPSSTAYRSQQQTVSYILGSSERLRTWITDK